MVHSPHAAERPGGMMTEGGASSPTKTGFSHKDFMDHPDKEKFQWSARGGLGSEEVERSMSREFFGDPFWKERRGGDCKAEGR